MREIICSQCGRIITYDGERPGFCSKCGAKLASDCAPELDELLIKAAKTEDTVVKHDLLLEAKRLFPDSLEVEKELLYLGRLWERGGKPDFYRIPYWPLQAFEKPGMFGKKQCAQMLDRFFNNPELERVSAMAPDKDRFLDEYIDRMTHEYIDMFIKSATSNTTFLGFRRKPIDVMHKCAGCVCTILKNIDKNKDIDTEMKMRLEWSFTREFGNLFETENGEEYLKSLM